MSRHPNQYGYGWLDHPDVDAEPRPCTCAPATTYLPAEYDWECPKHGEEAS